MYLAVFSSPATGYRWGSLYTSSNQGVFIDAHIQFFKEVQDAYSTVVYDNMRNVVQKFVGKHEKELNEELVKLSLFYGFQPVVTNTYSGRSCHNKIISKRTEGRSEWSSNRITSAFKQSKQLPS